MPDWRLPLYSSQNVTSTWSFLSDNGRPTKVYVFIMPAPAGRPRMATLWIKWLASHFLKDDVACTALNLKMLNNRATPCSCGTEGIIWGCECELYLKQCKTCLCLTITVLQPIFSLSLFAAAGFDKLLIILCPLIVSSKHSQNVSFFHSRSHFQTYQLKTSNALKSHWRTNNVRFYTYRLKDEYVSGLSKYWAPGQRETLEL